PPTLNARANRNARRISRLLGATPCARAAEPLRARGAQCKAAPPRLPAPFEKLSPSATSFFLPSPLGGEGLGVRGKAPLGLRPPPPPRPPPPGGRGENPLDKGLGRPRRGRFLPPPRPAPARRVRHDETATPAEFAAPPVLAAGAAGRRARLLGDRRPP